MDIAHTPNESVERALDVILGGFKDFSAAFATITQRAFQRFENRDWRGMRRDTVERLDLYPKIVDETTGMLLRSLEPQSRQPGMWAAIKKKYRLELQSRCDFDIACTFYNSIHRKVFAQTGIDPGLTFVEPPLVTPRIKPELFFDLTIDSLTPPTIASILKQYNFRTVFKHLAEDARLSAFRIGEWVDRLGGSTDGLRLQMLSIL